MIDPSLRAALEAATPAVLLPNRAQARVEELTDRPTVVDVLDLGRDGANAFVALLRIGDRILVVPGRLDGDGLHRDPGVASALVPGKQGSFTIETYGSGIPEDAPVELDVDQSNDSVILGDAMVKWQLDAAPSPAPERLRALAESGLTPALRALVTWTGDDGVERSILSAAEHLDQSRDGWTWAVELVRGYSQGKAVDALGPFAELGRMTARMHQHLADLGVGTWSRDRVDLLYTECVHHLDQACEAIDGEEGDRLRSRHDRLRGILSTVSSVASTPVMDIHGDLHIGQALQLSSGRQYVIVDFDGNPVLTPAQRMERQPAARDVAGMLASIDHVARVVIHRTPGVDSLAAKAWIPRAQSAFLDSYRESMAAAGRADLLDERLLPALLVDQEMREFLYSARHLPHWRYVPDAVITAMFPEEG